MKIPKNFVLIPRTVYYGMIDVVAIAVMVYMTSTIYAQGYYNSLIETFGSVFTTISVLVTLILMATPTLIYLSKSKRFNFDYIALLRSKIVFTIASFSWIAVSIVITINWTGVALSILFALFLIFPLVRDMYGEIKLSKAVPVRI
jgi:hypothetical protein